MSKRDELYKEREKSDSHYFKYQYEMGKSFQKYLIEEGYDLKNMYVADLGCSLGGETCSYKIHDPKRLVGVDLNHDFIKKAQIYSKELGLDVEFLTADIFDLPLESNSIDIVFSNNTIEHLPNINRLMPSISRILKDNGKARLSFESWYGPYAGHIAEQFPIPYFHFLPKKIIYWLIENSIYKTDIAPEVVKYKFDSCYYYSMKMINLLAAKAGFIILKKDLVIERHALWTSLRMSIAFFFRIRDYSLKDILESYRNCMSIFLPISFIFWIVRHVLKHVPVIREFTPDRYVLHLIKPIKE